MKKQPQQGAKKSTGSLSNSALARTPTVLSAFFLSLTSQLIPLQSIALDYDAEILIQTGYESNPSLEESVNEESEQVSRAGLILTLANQRDWYNFESSYAIFREEYGDDTLTDQTNTVGSTQLDVELIEDRLDFFSSHRVEQQRESIDDLDTADNQETITTLEGGLNFKIPVGKKAGVDLNAQAEDINIDASENAQTQRPDSESYTGGITFSYYPTRSNSFSASVQRVESRRDGSDIDQESTLAFVGYSRVSRDFRYNFQVGQSRFTFGDSKDNGLFISGSASYSTDSQSIELSVDQQNANTATGIISTDGDLDTIADSGLQVDSDSLIDSNSNSAVEVTRLTLEYGNNICPRCDLNIFFSHVDTDFDEEFTEDAADFTGDSELDITDRKVNLATLSFDYRLSRNLSAIFDYEWQNTSFSGENTVADTDFDEDTLALTLQWDVNNRLQLLADASREERRADGGGTRTNDSFTIAVNYLFLSNSPDKGRRSTRFDF